MRYHFPATKMAMHKDPIIVSVDDNMEKLEHTYTVGGNRK